MHPPAASLAPRKALVSGFLLGTLLLLNAAVVVPAVHHLWHDGHGCHEPECVVLALAQGCVHPGCAAPRVVRAEPAPLPLPAIPVGAPVVSGDCPLLPGRAPPR